MIEPIVPPIDRRPSVQDPAARPSRLSSFRHSQSHYSPNTGPQSQRTHRLTVENRSTPQSSLFDFRDSRGQTPYDSASAFRAARNSQSTPHL